MATLNQLKGQYVRYPASRLSMKVSDDGKRVLKAVFYLRPIKVDAWVAVKVKAADSKPYDDYDLTPEELADNKWEIDPTPAIK